MPVTELPYEAVVGLALNAKRINAAKAAPLVMALEIHKTGVGPIEYYEALGMTPEEAGRAQTEAKLKAALWNHSKTRR